MFVVFFEKGCFLFFLRMKYCVVILLFLFLIVTKDIIITIFVDTCIHNL